MLGLGWGLELKLVRLSRVSASQIFRPQSLRSQSIAVEESREFWFLGLRAGVKKTNFKPGFHQSWKPFCICFLSCFLCFVAFRVSASRLGILQVGRCRRAFRAAYKEELHGCTVDGQNPALPIIRNIP